MTKLKLFILNLLSSLIVFVGSASATTIDSAYLVSDTRNGDWFLHAGVSLDGSPSTIPEVTILGTGYLLSYDAWGGDYWINDLGINPPSLINGSTVSFTVDSHTVTGRVPYSDGDDATNTDDGYPGAFYVPYSTYHGAIGGTHKNPIISWSNPFNSLSPDNVFLDQYAIRVIENGVVGWALDHRIESGLESENQIFDFSSIPFMFDPEKEYTIRIEARRYEDLLDVTNSGGAANWVGVINRNVISADYIAPAPEPTTMLLFGIGLLGFTGLNRRKK